MTTIIAMTDAQKVYPVSLRTIVLSGIVAGVLDILAAITMRSLQTGKNSAEPVLRFVASGIFGREAFSGGEAMVFWGLAFHFIIAFCFAFLFFVLYPHLGFIKRYKVLGAIVYGLFVWVVMNRIVVPLSNTPRLPFKWEGALIHMVILIICIGIPVSFITHHYYKKHQQTSSL